MAYNIFLTDEDGYYILDDNGDRLIVGIGAGFDLSEQMLSKWRRIGGVVRRDITYVRSFTIQRGSDDQWRLKVNQQSLVGFYPNQEAAIAVLVGLITRNSGGNSLEWVTAHINNMLSKGSTSFIEVADNALALVRDNNDYVATLAEYVPGSIAPAAGTRYVALQYSDGNGVFTDSGAFGDLAGFKDPDSDATIVDDVRTYTFTGGYTGQTEDTSARVIIIDMAGSFNWVVTNVAPSNSVLKDDIKTLLSVSFSPSGDQTLTGSQTYTALATGTAQDAVYTWSVGGDTARVTSSLSPSGQIYELTWDDTLDQADDVVTLSVSATSASASGTTVTSATYNITLDHSETPATAISFDAEISGSDSLPAVAVESNGFAYAVTSNEVPTGVSFSYQWYQSVPTLTGVTLTNEGGA